jgi:membrane associated rhomboid family serine protease
MARHTDRQELLEALALVGVIWLVFAAECALPGRLTPYGITPRTERGLIGIVVAPLLHADLRHLVANTIPLAVLLVLLAGSTDRASVVVIAIALGGGTLLWLFGRPATHIGASGLVFGLITYLIVAGVREMRIVPLIVAVVVGVLYGGMLIPGILPQWSSTISWEGHLFGVIAGGVTAYMLTKRRGRTSAPIVGEE